MAKPKSKSEAKPKAAKAEKPAKAAKVVAAEEPKEESKPRSSGKTLVIVESPAKAKTINKYLGSKFVVKASMGHVRDLPKGKLGIDTEKNFEPSYQNIKTKTELIDDLKKHAKAAEKVYLAPDPDREGESIAWHLVEALELPKKKTFRVTFNEITKKAILEAMETPGQISEDRVNAQQARRVLDRIMGYKLSPLLWKKIAKGLSAGRVQSVAVRLIVEREREIRAFKSEEYWKITAKFLADGNEFTSLVHRIDGAMPEIKNEEQAKAILAKIGKNPFVVTSLETRTGQHRALPPFTTSLMQQQGSIQLRFSAKKTMMLAQQLYEGAELGSEGPVGLITYMRTDSFRISSEALTAVRDLIQKEYGEKYLPKEPNLYRSRKAAQEAHEAIRPTDVNRTPDSVKSYLSNDQYRLYKLIWERFVASQMTPAVYNFTTLLMDVANCQFISRGKVRVFDGHTRVIGEVDTKDEQLLPKLDIGSKLNPKSIEPSQHFTQPPPRYNEASLVKTLEKKGIGRPSTYAPIISTIQDRGYVTLQERKFFATELGEIVTDQLVAHFSRIINTEFTSEMEGDLDKVEEAKLKWVTVVRRFYDIFEDELEKAGSEMKNLKTEGELSEIKCDKCDSQMRILFNKRGKFLGCSKYPDCKNTMPMSGKKEKSEVIETPHKCPKCESMMVIRTGKNGRFLACSAYPKCKSTQSVDEQGNPVKPVAMGTCEKCGSDMIKKGSRRGPFLACSAYPKCRNAKPLPEEMREKPKETGEKCPDCGEPLVIRKSRWGKEFISCSGYPKCKFSRKMDEAPESTPQGSDEP